MPTMRTPMIVPLRAELAWKDSKSGPLKAPATINAATRKIPIRVR